ncbi:MAG: hypothetical protein JKX76_03940 [Colwellia sp.]|nr:hypothetical protein [Colwellia sp.]
MKLNPKIKKLGVIYTKKTDGGNVGVTFYIRQQGVQVPAMGHDIARGTDAPARKETSTTI